MVFGRDSHSRSEPSVTQQDLARYGRWANRYVAFVARTLLWVDVCTEFVPDRASVVSTLCTSAVPWFKNTGGAGTHTGRTSEPIRHALLTRRETLGPSLKKRRFHRLDLT